jgi:hypothetical protein
LYHLGIPDRIAGSTLVDVKEKWNWRIGRDLAIELRNTRRSY